VFSVFRVLVCDLRVLSLRFHPHRTTKPLGLTPPWVVQISPSDRRWPKIFSTRARTASPRPSSISMDAFYFLFFFRCNPAPTML
jgi:hypothetical protein